MGNIGPIGWGAIANMVPAALQGVIGGVQAARGAKGLKRTMDARPDYEIPQEYQNILAQYQQAYGGNMPGYERGLDQMGQISARNRGAAERGAISSNAYSSSVSNLQQKELDAIQNWNQSNAEFKLAGVDKIAGAEQMLGGQKEQQWNINKFLPWQTEMNRYGEMKKSGIENLFGGIQTATSGISDLLGTKYYTDALAKTRG